MVSLVTGPLAEERTRSDKHEEAGSFVDARKYFELLQSWRKMVELALELPAVQGTDQTLFPNGHNSQASDWAQLWMNSRKFIQSHVLQNLEDWTRTSFCPFLKSAFCRAIGPLCTEIVVSGKHR